MSTALAAARAKTKGKRMLRDALEGYGEDEYTLSEWNALKQQAVREGKWLWKAGDASATLAAVKGRVEKDASKDELHTKFATDLDAVMAAELHAPAAKTEDAPPSVQDPNQCGWRERIGGKQYGCVNVLPVERASKSTAAESETHAAQAQLPRRMCKWHARACVCVDHPMEKSRVIEIPNDQGFCLACYEATALKERGSLQKTPARLPSTKLPGVYEVNLKRDVQRQVLLKGAGSKNTNGDGVGSRRLTVQSMCAWEKEHSESAFIWQCRNTVVMHPKLRGAFLPFCGYHAPRCIQEYGASGARPAQACPAIDRRNAFGMCRNHVEAQLSTLPFEARAKCKFADTEFDVPGIIECRRDRLKPKPKRHPLAPKDPPPSAISENKNFDTMVVVKPHSTPPSRIELLYRQWATAQHQVAVAVQSVLGPAVSGILNHPNALSALLKEAIWQFQFLRRAAVVATRIQRIFRGNRARRRVRAILLEHSALRRLRATVKIQRIARGYLGRLAFAHEIEALRVAVPTIQRVMRGALARKRCRRLRAALRIQRNYRAYRQRCLAWAMREEMAYMRALQREADANYEEMLLQVAAFRRLRARRILRAHVAKWRRRKEEHARLAAQRLLNLLSAVKIQRAFRRYQYYKRLKLRYISAQQIQKRVRGWLTRHMWKDDPGVLWITSYVSSRTGFEYGKGVVLAQPSHSYAFPSRVIRMQAGAWAIQRLYRGFMGRMAANMRWVAMLKRWEWLNMNGASTSSTDSLTLGHERYGFLLPSYSYHHEKKRHMLPIKRGIKPDRGFAYKYQSILELLQDRDGKRAWSLAKEEQWKRAKTESTASTKHSPSKAHSPNARRGHADALESVEQKMVSMAQALYPVGCLVLVASVNRRDHQRFHKARIVAVHTDSEHQSHASTFDVEYLESFLSLRGVRIYTEPKVPVARLRPVGRMTQEEELNVRRRRPVGALIQTAIAQLKTEIQASRQQRLASTTSADAASSAEEGGPLKSVDAIVDKLRIEDPLADLLLDQRDFVNFVFQNSKLLRIKWLQVVDHVRYGTRDYELPPPARPTPPLTPPLSPSLLSFYQEFGFKVDDKPTLRPMPERARDIEQRMSLLGFQHDPSANIKDEELAAAKDTTDQRPNTTPADVLDAMNKGSTTTKVHPKESSDDLALDTLAASTSSSAQDLHRLIYELKTLPRERHREKILEVSTRNARSFVCGVPACGRCFSSHEAARLHQEGVHLHQRRLATATPLVDQYLHAYWPPQSPWNQELHRSFAPSVGYFQCSHNDCRDIGSDGQFRTRRELQRHVAQVHQGNNTTETSKVNKKPTGESESSTPPQRLQALSSLIWLGTYSMCRANLESRLEGFPKTATWHGSDAIQCETHRLTRPERERCRDCFLQSRRLVLPCRLYRAVALPSSSSSRQHDHHDGGEGRSMDGYVIFSVEDPLLCPVVREHDLVALDEDEAQRTKRLARQQLRSKVKNDHAEADSLVYLRLHSLCRDANGMNWAIGTVFCSVFHPQTKPFPSRSESPHADSSYEVVLDASHVVAVALEDIRAACVVHRCSQTVFQRKYFQSDSQVEMKRMLEPRRKQQDEAPHGLYRTLTRYWRENATSVDKEADEG